MTTQLEVNEVRRTYLTSALRDPMEHASDSDLSSHSIDLSCICAGEDKAYYPVTGPCPSLSRCGRALGNRLRELARSLAKDTVL